MKRLEHARMGCMDGSKWRHCYHVHPLQELQGMSIRVDRSIGRERGHRRVKRLEYAGTVYGWEQMETLLPYLPPEGVTRNGHRSRWTEGLLIEMMRTN